VIWVKLGRVRVRGDLVASWIERARERELCNAMGF
jgi:hypothetical protein